MHCAHLNPEAEAPFLLAYSRKTVNIPRQLDTLIWGWLNGGTVGKCSRKADGCVTVFTQ